MDLPDNTKEKLLKELFVIKLDLLLSVPETRIIYSLHT